MNTRFCSIPLNVLTAQPYNLPWGASVWAKIKARNIIGESAYSEPGNGSVILVVPDQPTQLMNLPKITNAYQVGITWVKPTNEGGTPVLDY